MAKIAWTMVGFILMKVSSCSHSVRPPKAATTTAVTTAMRGRWRVISHETPSAATLTTMKQAVARNSGPLCPASALPPVSGSIRPWTVGFSSNSRPNLNVAKNTTSGPRSRNSFSRGGASRVDISGPI